MRTFVLGDIHGAYRALRQCLDRSGFDRIHDRLIFLGDVCDGWPETRESIEELLTIKDLVWLMGNHDQMTLPWMVRGEIGAGWLNQGGDATMKSYHAGIPERHVQFLKDAKPYYILDDLCFVHAGIDPSRPIVFQDLDTFLWDRNLARRALEAHQTRVVGNLTSYREIFIGHTPIPFGKPVSAAGVWLMDTGAGWSGVLSLMDIVSKEVYQSDPVPSLYPGVQGRQRTDA